MLIRFSVSNFRSFRDEVSLSFLPGKATSHNEQLIAQNELGIDLLKFAMVYGANASGKSNLVRAIAFARSLVLEGTRPKQRIKVEPFKLERACAFAPTRMEFEFVAPNGQAYAYGFAITSDKIMEEWLSHFTSSDSEEVVFERRFVEDDGEETASYRYHFNEAVWSEDADQFLPFVGRMTRPNQLLLTQLFEAGIAEIDPILAWFLSIEFIFPESKHYSLPQLVRTDEQFSDALSRFLREMDTGVDCVKLQALSTDELAALIPQQMIDDMVQTISDVSDVSPQTAESNMTLIGPSDERLVVQLNEDGSYRAYALGTVRQSAEQQEIDFELSEESDGTKRLFDLFPSLYSANNRIFIIDELDRSLHPNLVEKFLAFFLRQKNGTQLLVTTHESTLLNLSLVRRDSIWFTEKRPNGATDLYSLEAFKPRKDRDIRKGYLNGRYGAVPVLGELTI